MGLFKPKFTDYVLHFAASATIAFLLTNICMIQEASVGFDTVKAGIIGIVVSAVAGLIKLFAVDQKFRLNRFIAIMIGGVLPMIANLIGAWFNNASYGG